MEFQWKTLRLVAGYMLLITTTLTDAQDLTVKLDRSKSPVKVGEQVVFTCTIQGVEESTVVAFNKVVRIDSAQQDFNKEQISVHTALSNPYKSSGRFKVEKTTEGSGLVYKLTIDGAQLEDGGAYSCAVLDSGKYDGKLLEVYRVPEEVKFVNYNESEVIEVLENQLLSNITCQISRVMPHPDVKLTVGDRDVTEYFLTSASINIHCSNIGANSKTCPLNSDYSLESIGREFKPTYADNGQKLSCSAKMRIFEQDTISTSIVLDVKHAPKVNCTSPVEITLNQTRAMLKCTVYGNPTVQSTTWKISKGNNAIREVTSSRISINPLSTEEYEAVDTIDLQNPSRIDSTLIIKPSFTKDRFQYTYSVHVTNELGGQTQQLIVRQQSDSSNSAGVNQLTSTYATISSTLLVLTSSILVSRYV